MLNNFGTNNSVFSFFALSTPGDFSMTPEHDVAQQAEQLLLYLCLVASLMQIF